MDYTEFRTLVQNPVEIVPTELLADLVAPPATEEDIAHAEHELGAKLPEDYVRILKEFGGGVLFCNDHSEEIYSVHRQHDSYIVNQQLPRELVQNFVGVVGNGCGDLYGFEVVDGVCQPRLVFCEHELGFEITPSKWPDILSFLAGIE